MKKTIKETEIDKIFYAIHNQLALNNTIGKGSNISASDFHRFSTAFTLFGIRPPYIV